MHALRVFPPEQLLRGAAAGIGLLALLCLGVRPGSAFPVQDDWREYLNNADRAYKARDLQTALSALESARTIAPDGLPMAHVLTRLGAVQMDLGLTLPARASFERSLEIWQKFAPADPDRVTPMMGLEAVYARIEQFTKAERMGRSALEIRERALGPLDRGLAGPLQSLAVVLQHEHRYPDALQLFTRALEVLENASDDAVAAQVHSNLGMLFDEMNQPGQAVTEVRRAVAIWERALGPEDPHVGIGLLNLATIYCHQHKWADAEEPIARAQYLIVAAYGPRHPLLDPVLYTYAAVLKHVGRAKDARTMERAADDLHSRVERDKGSSYTVDASGYR